MPSAHHLTKAIGRLSVAWQRWLLRSVPQGLAEADKVRSRVFVVTLLLALTMSGTYSVLALMTGLKALALLNGAGALFSFGALLHFRRTIDGRTTARAMLWFFTISLSLGSLCTSPIDPTNLFYLLALPLIAATMLSQAETTWWFARVMVAGTVTIVLGHMGWVLPTVDPVPLVTRVSNFLSVLVATWALMQALANDRERSLTRLREAERAKSAFFANVGHEIRTPMNGVMGLAEALALRDLGPDERAMVQALRSSGTLMLALLDDLLDLSKLQSKRLELHPQPMALSALSTELRAFWHPLARAKGLALELNLEPGLPDAVLMDGLRLRQILGNLLSNAIKFTERGTVALSFRAELGMLVCSVRDTGIGLSADHAARLFERFVQADDARARKYQGAGLGLALSRELTALMGGHLSVQAGLDTGSCFTCSVPLVRATLCASTPKREAEPLAEGCRVLVVDDNAINRLVAQRLLDQTGCVVDTASDASAALAILELRVFDAVLMDVHMPGLDGLEATRRLRARGIRAAIIGVSASSASEDIAACLDAGMNDFLPKPVTREKLLEALRRAALAAPPTDRRESTHQPLEKAS
jgi:signal transduction histidine kinase/CheY-like chemotaxis protein